jgi:hypothetical protein
MKNLIFISSPYTHEDPVVVEKNFVQVAKLSAHLTSKGYVTFSPIVYGHTLLSFRKMDADWETWKSFCLTFLKKSEEIWVYKMDGWNRSRGVAEEIEFAIKNNITIKYLDNEQFDF